ncbi:MULTISPECIES: bifunctional phosphopantothenoylcysteine decarboxylase/phosphopantothenate--cysteine ligase CoaBC [unclassified Mesorhizobium]|uniref:bifunctional phosphopantothenoylcysteine decarboxylase/phosphopantothenate--cysteine ligase CoaBC n=1 Tax=unclassified Mesorhizobium TaxID=325217 RepID=UPI0003CF3A2D|nr:MULTISPECIES: bifunctional phosphopantothenoylcysteine decarboxylase/phosphopantothenate--cysteine ligase CoaBC [unclassified Mesorhizobium]ESY52645.1 phosphopantothenate synthase [Mesorhizobium sp. LNJC374B00]ESY61450.1 phosphopantothenate synthase [Mesorhizobium sp. LNJC372A00]WJI83166.1 bifunctional phosphopantothenoylcysteine decarboxylase/phosphopantothenate--cysteine ligase CoaBC [Mesorhizobium sp. C374B]WJI89689.1 bifunctional phosphopantothenoylcysteine decarboxylase/phosphopantothen
MGTITVRNLADDVKQKLRERAAARGVSMEEEARDALAKSVLSAEAGMPESETLYATIRRLVEPHGGFDNDLSQRGQSTKTHSTLDGKRILLIIGGGIAAYKALDLIRRLRERGAAVRVVMTSAAQEFVTTLSVGALSADHVFTELFDRSDEHDVGHIRLSREADLLVVAPATADLMAKLANGHANDLASTVLLATDKKVLMAPAMNPKMWSHAATSRNRATLAKDGIAFVGPAKGEMAESNEAGEGRMAEPLEIVAVIEALLDSRPKPLAGRRIIVTSGPTHEPIDPVRYIANRSSGKQGHAIAAALARLGADVRLVSGPVGIADPAGVVTTHVETAAEMKAAVEQLLPANAAVFVAAVADWRTAGTAGEKIKKVAGQGPPALQMVENPDILAGVGHHGQRPGLVVGFAAETQDLIANAEAKLKKKGADFIVANDVSHESGVGPTGVMGGDRNKVRIVSEDGVEEWPEMGKDEVAARLAALIAERLQA